MIVSDKTWFVYLLLCSGNRIYTGITKNLTARLGDHKAGRGAMFTRLNAPDELLAVKPFPSKSEAAKVEFQIKHLGQQHKLIMVSSWREQYPLNKLAEDFPTLVQYIK